MATVKVLKNIWIYSEHTASAKLFGSISISPCSSSSCFLSTLPANSPVKTFLRQKLTQPTATFPCCFRCQVRWGNSIINVLVVREVLISFKSHSNQLRRKRKGKSKARFQIDRAKKNLTKYAFIIFEQNFINFKIMKAINTGCSLVEHEQYQSLQEG